MTGAEFLNFLCGETGVIGITDRNVNDSSYRAFMLKCLNLTIKNIQTRQEQWHWKWLEKTVTTPTVSGQMDYDMPTDIDDYKIFSVFDRTNNRNYTFVPHDKFLRYVPNPSLNTGGSYIYTLWADTLKLYPVPDSAYTLFVKYISKITALVDDANTIEIPEKYDPVIIDGALRYAYKFDPELGTETTQVALYEAGINQMEAENRTNINDLGVTESHRNKAGRGDIPRTDRL